jgi:hypothetical protein
VVLPRAGINMKRFCFALSLAFALTALAGCGPRMATLSGVVTLDAVPLDNGQIQIFPEAGDGQTASAEIGKDGRYQIPVASPTKMKVVISSSRVVSQRKKYEDVPDSPMINVYEEVVPPRYNDRKKTILTVDLVPGDNQKDFLLERDKKKEK